MEEQGLVVVKENFLVRIANAFKRIFFRNKSKDLLLDEGKNEDINNTKKAELIDNNADFVQLEILDARRAFRKYVINNNKNISNDILSYVIKKIEENEDEIKKIIEINKDDISFEDILNMLKTEMENVNCFKSRSKKTGLYNVPIGVIGVECDKAKNTIDAIFKSVSTRNAIIVLHKNYNKYSTEALILLIVKECIKNFYIDDNIIQMFEKNEIDLSNLDRYIEIDGKSRDEDDSNTIYIYQEDDDFESDVSEEVERLQKNELFKSYNIKPIKGEFGNIVNYLNANNSTAVCMYTNNTQKAYKFINWINSPNVFVNTGISNLKHVEKNNNIFYNFKNVLHEDVF